MIIREALSQLQTTFADAGSWLIDLSCKFGLGPDCIYTDWKELSVGQAAFVLSLAFAIVRLIVDGLVIRKFLAFCAAMISGTVLMLGEIYLVDHFPFNLPDNVPALPINLIIVLLCAVTPFFAASFIYRFVFNRLINAPKGPSLHVHPLT